LKRMAATEGGHLGPRGRGGRPDRIFPLTCSSSDDKWNCLRV
jgi:hypothetical protein